MESVMGADPSGRYARQLILDGFGDDSQRKLAEASVLVVGAGGLGAPVLTYLAAGGVGRLGIADFDRVSVSNLARQVLFTPDDVGELKAERAASRLTALNPAVACVPVLERVEEPNCRALMRGFDLVIDASDNLSTRLLLNRTALRSGLPYVWGAISQYSGRAGVALPGAGPCFECLFPDESAVPAGPVAGVFGPICAVVGGWMAGEALATLAGVRPALTGRLVEFDLRFGAAEALSVKPGNGCGAGCAES